MRECGRLYNVSQMGAQMTQEEAIRKIEYQIEQIEAIKRKERFYPEFNKWYRNTDVMIEKIFGNETRHTQDFQSIRYILSTYSNATPESSFVRAFTSGLDNAKAILESFVIEIEEYWEDVEARKTNKELSAFQTVEHICARFHRVARQLRYRHNGRYTLHIEDEYDVQDLFHALLALFFDDIRPEEWTPSYAGGSARMDFLLKQEEAVIEIKKTRKGLAAKEVGEQLIIDIEKYKVHPSCKTLVCFVYDPEGRVANPTGIENDLKRSEIGIEIKVIVAPKGY